MKSKRDMNIREQINTVQLLATITPDPVWHQQTRERLFAQYDAQKLAGLGKALFWEKFAFARIALVPAFAVLVFAVLLAKQAGDGDLPEQTFAFAPIKTRSVKVNSNLPLATSVGSTGKNRAATVVASELAKASKVSPRSRKIRKYISSTRLAVSVHSLPQSPWVFAQESSGQYAHWVFTDRFSNGI